MKPSTSIDSVWKNTMRKYTTASALAGCYNNFHLKGITFTRLITPSYIVAKRYFICSILDLKTKHQ